MKNKDLTSGCFVGFFLAASLAIWIGASYMEARTFNKFTDGPKATVVDAMFSQLRVNSDK